jgi:hypothetical protein
MADFPHPWDAYASLQAALSRGRYITDQSWGTEAAMNRILVSLQDNKPPAADQIARTAASERRRERHRARLRVIHLAGGDISARPEDALAARQELRVARSKVSERDWSVLCQLATGYNYAEVAAVNGGTPGTLRVRVLRCRQHLATKAA